jgi:L-fucose mutarotase/ribose pyranase (RbsD/FucU family)
MRKFRTCAPKNHDDGHHDETIVSDTNFATHNSVLTTLLTTINLLSHSYVKGALFERISPTEA